MSSSENKTLWKQRKFSLKRQIVVATWLFIIVMALILVTLLLGMINSYQKEEKERRRGEMTSYGKVLEDNVEKLRNVAGEIYTQNKDYSGINIYPSAAEKWDHIYNLLNVLHIQAKANPGIGGLFLYYDSFDWVQYAVNQNLSFGETEALKEAGRIALKSTDKIYTNYILEIENDIWYNAYMKNASTAVGGCIRLSQGLPDEKEKNAIYGVLFDGEFYPTWTEAGKREKELEETLLTKETIEKLQPGENHVDGKLIYFHPLGSGNMSVVEIVPENLWLYMNKIHVALMVLLILYLFAAVKLEKFVYRELSRPLEDMTKALSNIKAGVWEVQFTEPNRILEIEDVRHSVKALLAEIEQYKIKFYEKELEKAKIHRQYLQLQLAPHFYTNCLKNAYYMLALKEYDNAEIFLQRLSVHLRYLLQKDVGFVTIEKELDFVRNYVDLQKLMTSKLLFCEIEAEKEALDKEIPILSIQTFVENSVKYARDAKGRQLNIEISIKLRKTEDGNFLDIVVSDNGSGYPEELLEVINGQNPSEKEGMGVGIINLQDRIRIFYKDQASWYFENQGGAVSELILPERITEEK